METESDRVCTPSGQKRSSYDGKESLFYKDHSSSSTEKYEFGFLRDKEILFISANEEVKCIVRLRSLCDRSSDPQTATLCN